jgi:hypothetical protein
MDVYSHVTPSMRDDAARAMDRTLHKLVSLEDGIQEVDGSIPFGSTTFAGRASRIARRGDLRLPTSDPPTCFE